jgi:alanine racemase
MALNWVEIDASAIENNVREFRRRLGDGILLGAVVKSNGYGHGMREVATASLRAGADWLCVNNVEEGVALRREGHDAPILVMGYVPLEAQEAVVEYRLQPVVYNLETLDRLGAEAERRATVASVHLKVETGTNRQGVPEPLVPSFVQRIAGSGSLRLAGVSTHFANIEDTTDHRFAEEQLAAFARISGFVRETEGGAIRHAACSAAVLLFNRTHFDLARIGISLYGVWPSRETYVSCLERGKPSLDLKPVLSWKSRIAQIKDVPEGGYVGYGCTWRATRPTRIAVLPIGYYEGYDRGLSGVAHVLVRGRRAPVRGRVCMNMTMVDVTDIPAASLEDEVVLLGAQGDERVSAEQLAQWCGTIPYEILSRIHPTLPRVVR